ncbi:Quinone oxidoreductase [hydrothermal vent metagenome]|uniref:Quinone oxidoreductase n=1 Tax=hydrothermal vent metagenome TaxID=652676 RepID=A0A3B0S469_9ZZZZ
MTIPEIMTAIAIQQPGGPDVLHPVQMPTPQAGDGEILIKVAAAGINRPDILQRQGKYPPPPGASEIPGLEVAGTVCALGAGANRFNIGDEVLALVTGGGYAQYCLAAQENTLPKPQNLSMAQAGGIAETFFTVWTNVFDRAGLQPGEVFLIHGGTSGIGTTAIQLARSFGARVFATAGSDEKCAAAEKLGAEKCFNYKTQDFVAGIKTATDKHGADVILDMVGGDYIPRNIKAAASQGRIVSIAFLAGSKVEVDFLPMMLKRLTLTGSTLRVRSVAEKEKLANALYEKVWPLIEAGKVTPQLYKTFPLEEANKAHTLMETSSHIGKIVLLCE